jgi:uncharacterized protein YbjT (DUF2867 family)
MSALNVDFDPSLQPSRASGEKNKEVEAAAIGSGLEWVSPRPSWYAVNTFRAWAAQIRTGDVVRGPYAAFEEVPIDPRELAGAGPARCSPMSW